MPATTDALIMLNVYTASIIQLDPSDTSQENLDSIAVCCFISSSHTDANSPPEGPDNPNSRRTFITDLKPDSQIAWVGAAQNITNYPKSYVLITDIILNNNPGGIIIGAKIPTPAKPVTYGDTHIDAKVNPGNFPVNSYIEYKIKFTVCHEGTIKDNYPIDPKMRMT